jgi:hypothetical protein
MYRLKTIARAAGAATALLAGSLFITGSPAGAATPRWTIQYVNSTQSGFWSVYAASSSDVWAGGYTGILGISGTGTGALVSHWDGKTWTKPPLPAGFSHSGYSHTGVVYDLAGSAANNVWAIASSGSTGDMYTLEWNGVRWSAQHDWGGAGLSDLSVLSAANVWAADGDSGLYGAWHFNGSNWQVVKAPIIIEQLSALSATDIWAEGYTYDSTGAPVARVARWNGRTWSLVAMPYIEATYAISAASGSDVWVAGADVTSAGTPYPVALHWDGRQWTRHDPTQLRQLSFITSDGHGGAWAGDGVTDFGTGTLIHYSNGVWSKIAVPGRNGASSLISQIAVVPHCSSVWAAALLTDPSSPTAPQNAEVLSY